MEQRLLVELSAMSRNIDHFRECGTASGISGKASAAYFPEVMRPIRLPLNSLNQRLPSGPVVIPHSPLCTVFVAQLSVG